MVIYGLAAAGITLITTKSLKLRRFLNGCSIVLMDDDKIYMKNLKKAKLDLSEFMVLCRQEGYFNLKDIRTAIFEYNGRLTVLPLITKRPANPEDMNIIPKPEHISTEVIMDGRILYENLKRKGLDAKWLQKELKQQGFHSAKEIFLGLCDNDNNLTVFN